jgi:hypothetical protein
MNVFQNFIKSDGNKSITILLAIFSIQFFFYILIPNYIFFFNELLSVEFTISFTLNELKSITFDLIESGGIKWTGYSFLGFFALIYNSIFYLSIFIFFCYFSKTINENNKLSNDARLTSAILLLITIALLVINDVALFNNLLNGNFERTYIYREYLSGRTTHLNLCIILSVLNFRYNKKISIIAYTVITLYCFLSLSRAPMFYMFLLHIIINLKINKNLFKYLLLISVILFFLIFYRILFKLDAFNIVNILTDFNALHVNSFVHYQNLVMHLKEADFIIVYLQDNVNFFMNNFYIKADLIDYYDNSYLRSLSVRGSDSVLSYMICFIILSYVYYVLFSLNKKNNNQLFLVSMAYLTLISFRGNFVHNLAFVIKFHILIIILSWIIKKLKLLKSKVV